MEHLFGSITAVTGQLDASTMVAEAVSFAAWNICVGEMLRERTVPVRFHDRRLVIAVEDNSWKRHLEDLSPQMLVKLNAALGQGSIKFIEFRIDRDTLAKARASRTSTPSGDSKPVDIAPSLIAAANAIADEDLREQFLTAASEYLARQTPRL